MQAAEKDDFESRTDTEPLDDIEESQERGTHVEVTEVDKAYAELINESVSIECVPPLLLPAVIQSVDKVTISSEIKDKVQVQQYIKEVDDRDAAFQTVRMLKWRSCTVIKESFIMK